MEEKLKQAALRLQEVELLLAQPEVYADPARLRALTREQKELTPVVSAFGELEAARAMQSEAELMLSDPELRELAREELRQAKERQEALLQALKLLLLPSRAKACGSLAHSTTPSAKRVVWSAGSGASSAKRPSTRSPASQTGRVSHSTRNSAARPLPRSTRSTASTIPG